MASASSAGYCGDRAGIVEACGLRGIQSSNLFTLVAGETIVENGVLTGARPGRLVRSR